jgi:hypothetical protein
MLPDWDKDKRRREEERHPGAEGHLFRLGHDDVAQVAPHQYDTYDVEVIQLSHLIVC